MAVASEQADEVCAKIRMDRIDKTARICSRVIKVLFAIYLVGFVFLLVIRALTIIEYQEPFSSSDVGNLILGLFSGLLTLALLGLALSIFEIEAKGGKVFNVSVVKKIKIASAILLMSSLIQTILSSSFISFVTMGSFEFGYATVGGSIPIDASGIVVAIVFYCLALVYEYGAYLQFVSDNTV
jgi:sterol desaturase/sphingolipid hydroxylase (fatty acid hydroxylase superfamily)